MRTLPLRVQPVEGEAVDSWLEALAARMQCAWGDLLASVGLTAARGRSYTAGWLVATNDQQLKSMSVVTGQSPSAIRAMVLEPHRSTARPPDIPRESVESMLWLSKRRSRFCPACLGDNGGRWMLSWRLGGVSPVYDTIASWLMPALPARVRNGACRHRSPSSQSLASVRTSSSAVMAGASPAAVPSCPARPC